jgi:PAS domain S-box-containing protein
MPAAAHYALALGVVGIALIVRWLIDPQLGDQVPFITVFAVLLPLVVLVRPDAFLAAAILGLIGTRYLFISPRYSLRLTGEATEWRIATFAVATAAATFTAWLSQRARARQRRADLMLRAFVDDSPTCKWVTDPLGVIVYCNRAMADALGQKVEDVVGKTHAQILPPKLAQFAVQHIKAVRESGQPRTSFEEIEPLGANGARRVLEWRRFALKLNERGDVLVAGMANDITEKARMERALQESDSRFRRAADASRAIVYEVDLSPGAGGATHAEGVEQFIGAEARGAQLTSDWWHQRIHPDDLPTHLQNMQKHLEDHDCSTYYAEYRVRHSDGSWRTVNDTAQIERDGGKPLRLVGTILDITERKQLEQSLREADRRKDEFLATLSHELRNPLSPIRNALQILKSKPPTDPQTHWARDVIDRQVRVMARLLEDLLDVSRITQGKLELRRECVGIGSIVKSAVETSGPSIDAAGAMLQLDLDDATVYVDGDPVRLAQVLSNLLNNAAKYTDRGGTIRVSSRREGPNVVLSVKDNGIGIAPEAMAHLFEMFSQAQPALERSQGGLGIGLALVRGLVHLHGGTVEARSDGPGMGSEFLVRLPMSAAATAPRAPESPPPQPTVGPRRVLIAEDNHDAADSLAILLRLKGHDAHVARDGKEAIELAKRLLPDVALIDIGLPELNGYEVARHLRRQPGGAGMVLVAVTGWGHESDRQQAANAGFDRHLVKPVDPESLFELLDDPSSQNRQSQSR